MALANSRKSTTKDGSADTHPMHVESFLRSHTEMGELFRTFDWSSTALGPVSKWPDHLRTAVSLMLNSSFPMFIWWGREELTNLYNDAYKMILGNKHPNSLGKSAKESWAEIWDDIGPMAETVFGKGKPVYNKNLKLTVKRNDYEEEAYFTFSYSPIWGNNGKVAGLFCAVTETTEEVLAHQRLKESEDRFRNLADTAPMYIAMADQSGNAVYFNKPWLDFTGKRLAEMTKVGWLSVLHPDDAPRFEKDFKHAFTKHIPINEEYRFRRADGKYRWMLAVGAPRFTPDGHFIGYFGTYTDFHELKTTQLALEESEYRLRVMANNIPNLAWMAHPDGSVYWYNDRWYEYTGSTAQQADDGKNHLPEVWRSIVDPGYIDKVVDGWHHSIRTGRKFEMIFPLKGNDGKFRPFLTRMVPIRSGDGEVLQWIGTNTDISEQIKTREAEARNQELVHITGKLEIQRQELIKLNKAKDEFISLASHQLRTPATGVKQYLGILIGGYAGELTAKQREYAERSYESNERELRIINDLLNIAQLDAGRMTLNKERVDFIHLVSDIIDEQHDQMNERGQSVEFIKQGHIKPIQADKARMRMAIENLVDNASKYSLPNQRITVTLSWEEGDGGLTISIRDRGVGIKPADKNRIFDKYVRGDNSLSANIGGSGIGLYLVKKIILLHNGTISVSSKVGQGTVFTLKLPVR